MFILTYKGVELRFKKYGDFLRVCNRISGELTRNMLVEFKDIEELKGYARTIGLPGFVIYTLNNGVFRFNGKELKEMTSLPTEYAILTIGEEPQLSKTINITMDTEKVQQIIDKKVEEIKSMMEVAKEEDKPNLVVGVDFNSEEPSAVAVDLDTGKVEEIKLPSKKKGKKNGKSN